MAATGTGADDKLPKAGGTMAGRLILDALVPMQVTTGAVAGYVLTCDGSGNISLQPFVPGSGGGGSGVLTPTVRSSAYSANPSDLVACDATSASFTVTLPSAPSDGTQVGVMMIATASAHAVTVACAGSDVLNVASGATSTTLAILDQGTVFQYAAASHIWYALPYSAPLSGLDSRYLSLSARQYAPGTVATESVSSATLAAFDSTNLNTGSFTAPGSGSVIVEVSFTCSPPGAQVYGFALAAHGTVTPASNVITCEVSATTVQVPHLLKFLVTGLTAGSSYNFDLLGAAASGTLSIKALGTTSTTPTGAIGSPAVFITRAA